MDIAHRALRALSNLFMGLAVLSTLAPFYNLYTELKIYGWDLFRVNGLLNYQATTFLIFIIIAAFLFLVALGIKKILSMAEDIALIKGKLLD